MQGVVLMGIFSEDHMPIGAEQRVGDAQRTPRMKRRSMQGGPLGLGRQVVTPGWFRVQQLQDGRPLLRPRLP